MMKRRALGIVLSLVMALALGVTAMAAPSKTVTGVVESVKAEDADGKKVNVTVTEVKKEDVKVVEEVKKEETIKKVVGDSYNSNWAVIDVFGLKISGNAAEVKWPIVAKLEVAGITAKSAVKVVQWNGSEWVAVKATVKNGYIEAEFDEDAPIAIVADETTIKKTAAKTGDVTTGVVMMVAIAAVVAVVLGKKEFVR